MRFFGKSLRTVRSLRLPSARPVLEFLESRIVPYAVTGNAWPNPQLVTISFVPDGTVLALGNGGQITSNLFATFNKIPGVTSPAVWQSIILKAAQSWASQTNLNFALVPDDGAPAGSGVDQQGDPEFGDIRIGGFNVGSQWTSLAEAAYPPPANNYSIAGDVIFNTAYSFNIGSTFDLYTVAAHEIGHALGMDHSSSTTAVMYPVYNGADIFLGPDDIAGVRSIYSNSNARAADAYDAGTGDNSFATAANIKPTIDPNALTAVVNNLDITSVVGSRGTVATADLDYYKFTAPAGSAPTMTVTVQSAGLSLLSPTLTVYASNQTTVLGSISGRGQYGTTLTLSGIAVTPGATYYIKVQGADTTVFSTGAYALTLNLGTGPNPTVLSPNTQDPHGTPETAGGGVPMEPATNPSPGFAGLLSPISAVLNLVTGAVSGLLGGALGLGGNVTGGSGSGGSLYLGATLNVNGSLTGAGTPTSIVPISLPTSDAGNWIDLQLAVTPGSSTPISATATDLLFATLAPLQGSSDLLPSLALDPVLIL
jgi:matrixin